tara:strand:- start:1185 stop:1478 length:294 start_codon:yes stop_codon:yes gene_type:complete
MVEDRDTVADITASVRIEITAPELCGLQAVTKENCQAENHGRQGFIQAGPGPHLNHPSTLNNNSSIPAKRKSSPNYPHFKDIGQIPPLQLNWISFRH